MITERYQALFTLVGQAIRDGWANDKFWAFVEKELIDIDSDSPSLRFILPQTFTLEDEIARMIGDAGVAN